MVSPTPTTQDFDPALLVHFNNLEQKKRTALTVDQRALLNQALAAYEGYVSRIDYAAIANGDVTASIIALEEYLTATKIIEKQDPCFNWRSDFCGSIIPEFLYRSLRGIFHHRKIPGLFSTRESVVELTISGAQDGGWEIRRKNQDLSIGLRRESVMSGKGACTFLVPVIAMEVKTNIDINKLNGLDFSAERLKRTFPSAHYFLVSETIDFSLDDNYASGSIDEVYVLRRQVRSQARRNRVPLQPEVFGQVFADVTALMLDESVIHGHVYDRLASGKLIHGHTDPRPPEDQQNNAAAALHPRDKA